jgi:ribonuclease T2
LASTIYSSTCKTIPLPSTISWNGIGDILQTKLNTLLLFPLPKNPPLTTSLPPRNTYWIAQNQDNAGFWGHEFSKHATCFSTFNTPCYGPQYTEHEEVVDFFETTIAYYKRVPTFDWLAEAQITPSNTTQYSYTDIVDVLTEKHGAIPFIGCSGPRFNATAQGTNSTDRGYTRLTEVWYYDWVYGRPQEGDTVPVNASASYQTNCAKTEGALWYYERTEGSEKKPAVPY